MDHPPVLGVCLWILLGLFFCRVLGQLLVVLYGPRWLPPMAQWYSGLIPYRLLLPAQVVFLTLMAAMASDVTRGEGFFAAPRPDLGRGILWFSCLYAGSMVVRYAVRMIRRPDQRWLGGTIPISFHVVLAAFLWVFARYHLGR
jgi:hypothetical protein